MKILFAASCVFLSLALQGQNEFANAEFYSTFRKLKTDGANGFTACKGNKLRSLGIFFDIYTCKWNLPGADSGRIILPVSVGSPAAHFYFKPLATLDAAQQKEVSLLTAIKTAWGVNPVVKKLTDTVKNFVFHRTRLYKEEPAYSFINPDVETYVMKEKNKFVLVVQLHGSNPPPKATGKSKLSPEPDLNTRIKELIASMEKGFAGEKAKLLNTTQYYTEYESNYRLHGFTGKAKFRTYEQSFSWNLGSTLLDSPDEAKQLFEKIKAAFIASGKFLLKPETKEGSRTWLYAYVPGKNGGISQYSLLLEYYSDPYTFSVSFLLTKKY